MSGNQAIPLTPIAACLFDFMTDFDSFAKTGHWDGSDNELVAKDPRFAPPTHVGRYRIERVLGTGGFGIVYLATDEGLGRQVAVKIPHRYLIESHDNVADYLREAQTVAKLDHPNIVPVHDVSSTERFPCFVVSKYIEGGDLAETMQSSPLDFRETAALVATLADALHYAHTQRVVHRDIKPSNILLTADRTPYLVDFGLALRDGELKAGKRYVGTPAYSSPEQARGEGHRIDGRSDLFSLGVVMYELLAGCKPFIANSTRNVLTAVIGAEPKPLREVNDAIPKELERICFRALCKRASERYSTGEELADDLRSFLQSNEGAAQWTAPAPRAVAGDVTSRGSSHATVPPSSEAAPAIVPKGLRSFDVDDAEFFVELLPGPRDRHGVPDSIRRWLTRIHMPHIADSCPVGVVYGPSGCGKSSLIKAGIMPRLDASVVPVYVEATRHETERMLLRSLRHACDEVSPEDSLSATLAAIRRGTLLGPDRKLLLVIDQFEQWLHEHEGDDQTELMNALRQCDGHRVQAILLVRDDFWMAISHFMAQLDIPLVDSQNTMGIQLFDKRHATKVLESFGRAYGALPAAPAPLAPDHKKFLSYAVNELARDGRVICLDIALFADMLSGKPWRTETWRSFGGTRGVGVQFLEDAFSAKTAPADSRIHNQAAQAVLKLLLPDPGSDLKGHSRTEAELFAASGYQRRKDFDALLALLDHKLRLITPVAQTVIHRTTDDDSQVSQQQETLYQLTHDFLVHAVQEWLKRKQEETRRGRAQRRLAELTAMYSVSPSTKLLPSTWEYVRLRSWTDRRHWSDAEKQLMRAGGKSLARRWLLASLGLAVLMAAALTTRMVLTRQAREQRVEGLVARLLDADLGAVEDVTLELRGQGTLAYSRLLQVAEDAVRPDRERLRAHLSLIDRHEPSAAYVTDEALRASPDELAILCKFLGERQQRVVTHVSNILDGDVTLDVQLHAAAILAQLQEASALDDSTAVRVATALVEQNQLTVSAWLPLLAPASDSLQTPLENFFANRDDPASSQNAAIALAGLSAHDSANLTDLALMAEPQQFVVLFPALAASPEPAAERFRQALDAKSTPPWPQIVPARGQRELPESLRDTIEASVGIADENFAFVQRLPWNEFEPLANALAEFGYRPAVVRPYGSTSLQTAAIWSRDGDQWELVRDVSADEVLAAHKRNRDRGWIARDFARYESTAADGAKQMLFAALWSPAAENEEVIEGELYVAVPEAEHEDAWRPLNARGFIPRTNLKFHDDAGQPYYTSLRWRLTHTFGYRDVWDAESFQSADLLDPWNWRQADIRVADDATGTGPKIAATWWQDPTHTARLVKENDLRKHLDECAKLIAQGYRPSSISVHEGTAGGEQQAASVWSRPLPDRAAEEVLAARQANALIGLWRLGQYEVVKPWLSTRRDQRVRSEFIHRAAKMGVSAESLAAAFAREKDVIARESLLAALSYFRPTHLTFRQRSALEATLLTLFRTEPHAGLHSHIELLLRRWNRAAAIQQITSELLTAPAATDTDDKDWLVVTPTGMTLSIVRGPADFLMGSPLDEPGRDDQQEARHLRRVDRTYALGTREVTVAEFSRYRPDFDYPPEYSPSPDCPIVHLDWYDAVRYCRWLSEVEHVPDAEMCYPPLDEIGDGMSIPDDFLQRTGYRLPTEAEWEYACRAASETSRHFGDQASLLGKYAWTAENSNYRSSPVALLLPNDFGLFDMLGNAMEWCQDQDAGYPTPSVEIRYDDRQITTAHDGEGRVSRGGGFLYQPLDARSAQHDSHYITSRRPYLGFRVARTIRPLAQEISE